MGEHVKHLIRFATGGTIALALVAPSSGCGDYDPEAPAAAGGVGTTMTTGGLNPGGQGALAGAAGAAGQSSMGGSAGSGGGAAGAAGAAGMAGVSDGGMEVTPVEADCDAVEPCGGAVAGAWVAAGSCLPVSGMVDVSGFGLGCTQVPVTGTLEVAGPWTANPDGTFVDQTTTSGDSELALPPACLNISGTVTTCDRLGGALQALGYAEVTCVDAASGGGCTCAASVQQTGGLASVSLSPASGGTYASANNVLTTTSAGVDTAYAYCVSGNQMIMTPQTVRATGALTGTIVFVKP